MKDMGSIVVVVGEKSGDSAEYAAGKDLLFQLSARCAFRGCTIK